VSTRTDKLPIRQYASNESVNSALVLIGNHVCLLVLQNGHASPFPHFATFVSIAARINNLLNVPLATSGGPPEELHALQQRLISWYQGLPLELGWSPRK
jgi:hypothetical protein